MLQEAAKCGIFGVVIVDVSEIETLIFPDQNFRLLMNPLGMSLKKVYHLFI